MAAVTVEDTSPYAVLRTTAPADIGKTRRVNLPPWVQSFTVEAPAGGSDLQVAVQGTDEGALTAAKFVDVYTGAGPRRFSAYGGGQAGQIKVIFIASLGASAAFVVEAMAAAD